MKSVKIKDNLQESFLTFLLLDNEKRNKKQVVKRRYTVIVTSTHRIYNVLVKSRHTTIVASTHKIYNTKFVCVIDNPTCCCLSPTFKNVEIISNPSFILSNSKLRFKSFLFKNQIYKP